MKKGTMMCIVPFILYLCIGKEVKAWKQTFQSIDFLPTRVF